MESLSEHISRIDDPETAEAIRRAYATFREQTHPDSGRVQPEPYRRPAEYWDKIARSQRELEERQRAQMTPQEAARKDRWLDGLAARNQGQATAEQILQMFNTFYRQAYVGDLSPLAAQALAMRRLSWMEMHDVFKAAQDARQKEAYQASQKTSLGGDLSLPQRDAPSSANAVPYKFFLSLADGYVKARKKHAALRERLVQMRARGELPDAETCASLGNDEVWHADDPENN